MQAAFKWGCAAALLVGAALQGQAQAQTQDYPSKTVTMVVPYAAGGGTDVVARTLAEQMGRQLGQTLIIENKPGASGILGTNYVAKASPDGYTVLVALTQSLLTNQFLYDKLSYDPRKELTMVTQIATAPLLLLVSAASPIKTVADLQREMRGSAGGGNCGSWGAGSYPHLACAHMAQSWKANITHIAYKGEAPMLQDLVGGQLSFTFGSIVSAKPYLDSGKMRAIAITGDQRMPLLKSVPTFAEAGFPDAEYRMSGWLALAVPRATPKPVVLRLQQAAQQALASPDLLQRFEVLGMVPMGTSAEQFAKNYEVDWPVWERLVKISGAKLD
jgi:tripartite-type tricarboxylate transporter receptor subunit TctC